MYFLYGSFITRFERVSIVCILNMATLNDFKEETMKVCRQKGWDSVSTELLWLLFIEEIGELASAIRRTSNNFTDRKRANVTSEWYDCLSYLFQLADRFQIDLDSSWEDYVRQLKRRRQTF